MASDQKYPIDLKFAKYPNTGDPKLDMELGILYNGIRNLAGDYFDNSTPAIPFKAAGPGAVGNGTYTYFFRIREGMIRLDATLAIGATTALGGGAVPILFATPVGYPPLANQVSSGTAVIFCAAAVPQLQTGIVFCNPPGPDLVIHLPQIGIITPAFPAAWAAGDSISFSIDYPYVQ